MSRFQPFLTVLAIAFSVLPAAAEPPPAPAGRWLTQDRDGVIEIAPCGRHLCGWVVGLTGFKPDGTPPLDWRGRPQCRFNLIRDMAAAGPDLWEGEIVNPEDGKTYRARMWVDDGGDLRLRGYIVVPLFGQTQTWSRFHGQVAADCRMQ